VARQLIGKGDINMGLKAKKFTKIEAKFGCPLWVISGHTAKSAPMSALPPRADMVRVGIDVF
jgi:hypothetical protein